MRRLPRALAVALSVAAIATGCVADSLAPPEPRRRAVTTPVSGIRLEDVSVGVGTLDERAGLYLCGRRVVASAPSGGIPVDSFVVFDPISGEGRITEVELPDGLRPNARWLLTTECVDSGGTPFLSVAYQEMPLALPGGGGVRAAYSLGGEQLWMRDDLNQPAAVVGGTLVLGSAPEAPEAAVDLRTGETVATFRRPALEARTVVGDDRMVARSLSRPPVLTTLAGRRVRRLREAAFFVADERVLYGVNTAAFADVKARGDADSQQRERPGTKGSVTPDRGGSANERAGGFPGKVQAYGLRTGRRVWRLDVAPDPLGVPTAEPQTGVVVVVDTAGIARGIDADSGRRLWHAPTELLHPRVTTGGGIVLFDRLDERFQKVVDARTGLPLPEPENPIVDIGAVGALQLVDGTPRVVPIDRLRHAPPTEIRIG
ncbi:MAG: PQQ-binding-like beta-propeller repeat protein [Nocardioidaceae bacterium]